MKPAGRERSVRARVGGSPRRGREVPGGACGPAFMRAHRGGPRAAVVEEL